MLLPFDRERLRLRNDLDDAEARAEAAVQTPEARVLKALELSQLVIELQIATGGSEQPREKALALKARLYYEPLRLLASR